MGELVETRAGKLEGVREDGIRVFRGVPYAQPPVGGLRFRAPRPVEPWAGVRDAARFGPSAPQTELQIDFLPGMDVGAQSEDCLYLNVFAPGARGERRPVLVWIHGGAFTIGSGSQSLYDVRPIVRRGDVIVVTLNYRLGALGFLHLAESAGETFADAANAGVLDQVAALAWVRDNIAAFGGDPANVTIFGESAGGMSVGTLLGMPAARGLFQRAIAQSGAAHSANDAASAERVAAMFCEELGIAAGDGAALRRAPVEAILEAQARVGARTQSEQLLPFRPVVDGRALPEAPIEAVRRGLSREVAVIAGYTRDEWKLFVFMDPQGQKLDEPTLLARAEQRAPGRGEGLVRAYRAALGPAAKPYELFCALERDRIFGIPAVRLAEAQRRWQPNTYLYEFSWPAAMFGGLLGACHGIDVPFVMGSIGTPAGDRFAGAGAEALALQDRVMEAWLAFARSGDPRHAGLASWQPYDEGARLAMELGRRCEPLRLPDDALLRAWDGVL
nr:esterase [uncultured bacterium]